MVTGVVSRKIDSLGASTIDCGDRSAQVLVENPLPGRLACADHHLELDASAVASPSCPTRIGGRAGQVKAAAPVANAG
jgi:hypothetical protein